MPTTIQLQLSDTQLEDMRQYYMFRLKDLREEKDDIEKEIEKVENVVQQLSAKGVSTKDKDKEKERAIRPPSQLAIGEMNGYVIGWPIHEKISYVLRKGGGRPMPTREIIDELFKIDHSMLKDKDKAAKNISSVLSMKNGELYAREKNGNEYAYILK